MIKFQSSYAKRRESLSQKKKINKTTKTNPYVIGASEPGVLAHTYNPSMKKD